MRTPDRPQGGEGGETGHQATHIDEDDHDQIVIIITIIIMITSLSSAVRGVTSVMLVCQIPVGLHPLVIITIMMAPHPTMGPVWHHTQLTSQLCKKTPNLGP
jgi:hypothetical protein